MWEYKVIAGRYSLDGSEVVIENATGRTTLQKALTYYGKQGYEVIDSNLDAINREAVLTLKRPFGGAAAPAAAAAAAFEPPVAPLDEALPPPPARRASSSRGGRRTKEELDRLYRDTD